MTCKLQKSGPDTTRMKLQITVQNAACTIGRARLDAKSLLSARMRHAPVEIGPDYPNYPFGLIVNQWPCP